MRKIGLLGVLLLATSFAQAQQKPSREQEQLKRLRAQTQQLQQALSVEQQAKQQAVAEADRLRKAAETDLPKFEAAAAAARHRASGAREQADRLGRDLDEARQAGEALTRRLEDAHNRLAARERELEQMRGALRTTEHELGSARAQADSLGGRLAQCGTDNVALYRTGIEVLDHYRDRTLGERLAQAEPFAQTGRVKLENLIEGYRDRLDAHRMVSASGAH